MVAGQLQYASQNTHKNGNQKAVVDRPAWRFTMAMVVVNETQDGAMHTASWIRLHCTPKIQKKE